MAEFIELARLRVSDSTEIVISKVKDSKEIKGVSIVPYITSAKYTGYTKGIFIPVEKIDDFKNLVARSMS